MRDEHKNFPGIESLRGICSILVFLAHCGVFIPSFGLWGGAAVSAFFVVSGFLSGYHYKKKNVTVLRESWETVLNKLKRFYPLYIIMFLCAVVLNRGGLKDGILNIFLIQSWFGCTSAQSFNSVGWFLSSIMFSYLIAPAINRGIRLIKGKLPVIYSMIGALAIIEFLLAIACRECALPGQAGYWLLYFCPLTRAIDFTMGTLMGHAYREQSSDTDIHTSTILEAVVCLTYLFLLTIGSAVPFYIKASALWCLPSCALVKVFADSKGKITAFCNGNSLIRYMGKNSFYFFIIHFEILTFFHKFAPQPLAIVPAYIATILLTEGYVNLSAKRTLEKRA